jgi:CRISPR-associated endonuclease Csn1
MASRNILGLDLGTTSIGWAHVIEGEMHSQSDIIQIGVRVNPLTTDEQTNFEKGKPVTVNADRTLKRAARRNLQRFKLRRENLIDALTEAGLINKDTKLAEDGKNTTHETWRLRSKAVNDRIEKDELARVFLAINKKRGYKSSRKAKNDDEGQIIDGMAIAKQLYEDKLTPGQYCLRLLKSGKKNLPDFYRSDLQQEFDQVWVEQKKHHPEVLTDEFYRELQGKGQKATSSAFWNKYGFNTSENKGSREDKRLQAYEWRARANHERLEKEEMAYVLTEINSNLNNSSGYLGAISDRSKELYFKKLKVGQYLYQQLEKSPHSKLKNQVFYRQDYLDEFEAIWQEQAKHHKELTNDLKTEIRDIIIFYQRKLKSQKNLISLCEHESREKEINGVKKTIGQRVAPRSSALFQEFKIWQNLNNIEIRNKLTKEVKVLDQECKTILFNELNIKGNLSSAAAIQLLGYKPKEWEMNYEKIEGNHTNKVLYEAYLKILDAEGYDVKELLGLKTDKDDLKLEDITAEAEKIKALVREIFKTIGINENILDFNPELQGKEFEFQASYQLWHLLYAYEGDDSVSGNERLYRLLQNKFGFKLEHAKILSNVSFISDYGSLSTKALRNIYPFIKENKYDVACELAGYRHSKHSLTKDEKKSRPLMNTLPLYKKNSLRNPVVEKILNQMINVVNTLIETNSKKDKDGNIIEYFKFDEIRIELARELKKNAKERAEMTANINKAKIKHDKIIKILQSEFGVPNPSRNDIIRYKLYEELRNNGYKDLYSDKYIPKEILFSKQIDVDHIIPQARLFDDSFSNKTLTYREINLKKGNNTAYDFILSEYGKDKAEEFIKRAEKLFDHGKKNEEEGISYAKLKKLQMKDADIGDNFINRDLQETRYISKKAKELLFQITRSIVVTTGSITDRLREDWGLINVMQELNFEKFKQLGLTEKVEKKDGSFKERIVDWSKRNDHRHHSMDALTVAFTRHNHIQYLNYLNARFNESHKEHHIIKAIEEKETYVVKDDLGNKRRVFIAPMENFRQKAKKQLEAVLVSHKAKNKVVTKNKNVTKLKTGSLVKTELTPRGQLHKETVYGKIKIPVVYEEKVSAKFDETLISKIANPLFKSLLLERLQAFGNDSKLAFTGKNSLAKNPIYLNADKTDVLPEKVKINALEDDYTIRKDVNPDNFNDEKSIDKVIDKKVKEILKQRLSFYGSDPRKAFSDLDKNPIWLNKDKGIAIKRVTISGVKNAEPLHFKKDHLGKPILDKDGKQIPADFISTGNNHHVAIYKDAEGNLQERVVSFYEAVQLINAGLPVVDTEFNKGLGWQFLFSMKQNEYFVFPNEKTGFDPREIDLLDAKNYSIISQNLFRVQKISTKNYVFNNHIETKAIDGEILKTKKALAGIMYHFVQTPSKLERLVKVRINHIGQIIQVGEDLSKLNNSIFNFLEEPSAIYRTKTTISSYEQDAEAMRNHTANLSPEERMAYLQKLREITHDKETPENSSDNGKIQIRPLDENS